MEPRVTKTEKKILLSYDLPHRIRCSAIFPHKSPNRSAVIFYGHDAGLRILWRGGRRPIPPLKSKRTTESEGDIIDLEDEDESIHNSHNDADLEEEDEVDLHSEAPGIICYLDIELPSAVSKITIPLPPQPTETLSHATIVVATLDGAIHLLRIPLMPAKQDEEKEFANAVLENSLQLDHSASYTRVLSSKCVGEDKIVVVAGSEKADIWHIELKESLRSSTTSHQSISRPGILTGLSMHPATRSPEMIIVDKLGSASVYEAQESGQGRWLYTLHAPYQATGERTPRPEKKRILDAQYILGGRCILALLDDGQWGIWDVSGTQQTKPFDQFVLSGYLESAINSDTIESISHKQTTSGLTPMTPNTRKVKSNDLFATTTSRKTYGTATGGISISRTTTAAGVSDESVILWHNSDIYTIPSMQGFWQRSTSGSSSIGTLYAPGIARVQGVNVFNERITSISQLEPASSTSLFGKIKLTRDFVLSTEHRLMFCHNRAVPAMMQKLADQTETRDQRMLDAGELDLGGMDRILSTMEGRNKKVGFVH